MRDIIKNLVSKYRVVGKYVIPSLPNELKFAKTPREKKYLDIINELMTTIKKDPMTGLQHKEHFRTQTRGRGVYIMVDGDGLKKMNDTYGHEVGHAAIMALSDGIKAALRSEDKAKVTEPKADAMRAGGDEFLIYIEDVTMSVGVVIAKRMLDSIHKQKISKHYEGTDSHIKEALDHITLKASFGVGYTEEDADKAMYKAKEKGRDRVEFFKKLKQVHASNKTFTDYLFENTEEDKRKVAAIESKVRAEYKGRPEISTLLEITHQLSKKDAQVPSWVKIKAIDVYDKMKDMLPAEERSNAD